MSDVCTVYVTTAHREEAVAIARTVVSERLAACANILPDVTAIYQWQGQMHEEVEAALLLKTRRDLFERLAARIRELHSYDTPCIVAWPIVAGDDGYLAWVQAETIS